MTARRLVFLGPPGAGKGTQARMLAGAQKLAHVATGDMLRDAIAAGTDLGRLAKGYYDRGELVPDDVVTRMLADRLQHVDAAEGFILDGFPRTIAQAEALERLLKDLGQDLERVVFFDVPEAELIRRLTERRKIEGRADDTDDAIRNRLRIYAAQTAPLLDHYRSRSLLLSLPGIGTVEAIADALRRALSR